MSLSSVALVIQLGRGVEATRNVTDENVVVCKEWVSVTPSSTLVPNHIFVFKEQNPMSSSRAIAEALAHDLTSDELHLVMHMIEASVSLDDGSLYLEDMDQVLTRTGFSRPQAARIIQGMEMHEIMSLDISGSILLPFCNGDMKWMINGMDYRPEPRPPKNPPEPEPPSGYIYLVHADGTEWYKIGITKDIEKRAMNLGAKAPFDVKVVTSRWVPNNKALESRLHKELDSKRVNGEWFSLSLNEVDYVKRTIRGELGESTCRLSE